MAKENEAVTTEIPVGAGLETMLKDAQKAINYRPDGQPTTFAEAQQLLQSREAFDPGLSQFVEGQVIYMDPKAKVGLSNIGNNGAVVITVPAGTIVDGKPKMTKAMNVYLSTFGKTIRVTDVAGEPVQNPDGSQKEVTGAGNPIWDAVHAAKNDWEKSQVVMGKYLKVVKILRDFGPAGFVGEQGNRHPTSRRLTSLPLFEEVK